MDKCKCGLERQLERFHGQPVEILTSDGVRYCGIVLMVCDNAVELIDKCSRVIFLPYRHIDALIEPKMTLTPFCGRSSCHCRHDDCECEHKEHKEKECEYDDDYDDIP